MIRKLTDTDVHELKELSIKTFNDAYAYANTQKNMNAYVSEFFSENQFKKELNTSGISYFGYYLTNKLIGYCKLHRGVNENHKNDNTSVELARFYVLNTYQSKGIGKEILQYCKQLLKKEGYMVLWLAVWQENKNAIRFYEKTGFIQSGETQFMLGTELNEDFIYKMNI